MTAVEDAAARSIALKQELVSYLRDRRVAREYEEALEEEFGDEEPDEDDLIDFRDEFLLEFPLSDDRTPVERFVRARGDLPRAERDLLLSWTDPWDSVFEVGPLDGDVLHVTSLVEETPFRVRSAEGGLDRLEAGSLVGLRLVPAGEDWLLVGSVLTVPDDTLLLRTAAEEALTHDESCCSNASHRVQAADLQREEREAFLAYFGADFVVLPGSQLPDSLAGLWTALGREWDAAPEDWPEDLLALEQVGLGYDAVNGLTFYEEFADVRAAFEAQEPSAEQLELVRDHVEDPDCSPQLLLACIDAHPGRRDAVLAAALEQASFSWERDGEALLREFKATYLEGTPAPAVSVVPERLLPYVEKPAAARILLARA